MEILIGRDKDTTKLRLTSGDKSILHGTGGVPVSVASEHCRLEVNDQNLRIKNLDISAYTYVNGQAIESKAITRDDHIELGTDRYPFDWKAIDSFIPPISDIRPLQSIWEHYEDENIKIQIAERKFNTLRSATGIITMAAIALSIATGGRSVWYIVLYGAAIIISLLFFVKAYRDSSQMPQKRQQLSRQFQKDYVCPHCGHFLGNQTYDILAQNDCCPYCKAKFIH